MNCKFCNLRVEYISLNCYEFSRVSVQVVVSLSGHFETLCREFDFYAVRKINMYIIIFQKENGNTFILLIIVLEKSLQKEQIAPITQCSMTPDLPE